MTRKTLTWENVNVTGDGTWDYYGNAEQAIKKLGGASKLSRNGERNRFFIVQVAGFGYGYGAFPRIQLMPDAPLLSEVGPIC